MSRLRTFLGIALEPALRARLVALQRNLAKGAAEVKWVEEENLHLTLLFLGEVDDRELLAICRGAQEALRTLPAFPLSIEGAGCFPNLRRPRTLWVGVGSGAQEVVAVHAALESALLELSCYRREERQYTPHVTLGRLKSEGPAEQLGALLQKYHDWKAGESQVHEVQILSSQLTPRGPIYAVLGRAKLS